MALSPAAQLTFETLEAAEAAHIALVHDQIRALHDAAVAAVGVGIAGVTVETNDDPDRERRWSLTFDVADHVAAAEAAGGADQTVVGHDLVEQVRKLAEHLTSDAHLPTREVWHVVSEALRLV